MARTHTGQLHIVRVAAWDQVERTAGEALQIVSVSSPLPVQTKSDIIHILLYLQASYSVY